MHSKLRTPFWGIIETILILILIITIVCGSIYNKNKYTELEKINNSLSTTIDEQDSTIKKLKKENTGLKANMSQLKKEKKQLKKEKEKLRGKNIKLRAENTKLKEENIKTQTRTYNTKTTTKTSSKDFKSYMPYTAITNKASKQWKLQQLAYTDANGLRCINGRPMVAVGTGWGLSVGNIALITCDNGNKFEVVIGDIKANIHTLADNKTTLSNNCRCEFIVDSKKLNSKVRSSGNVAVLQQYSGYVVNVQKIGNI